MKQKAKELIKHPLIFGSGIVVFGNLGANFFNFIFNVFMSHSLNIADYGILASSMSLIGFPALIGTALIPVVIKFAGSYFATGNIPLLRGLYFKLKKSLVGIGIIIVSLFLLFLPNISNFFHIENNLILIITAFVIFLTLISVLNIAFLQAKLAFTFQVFVNLLNSTLKLFLGILFVFLGYSVTGAVIALFIAGIASYIFSFFPLKFIFAKGIAIPQISTKKLFSYGIPSSLTLFGLTSFISTDIILVKHFFDPQQAGLYAGLSLMARIIFYVTAPISSVMFPIIVQKYNRQENYTNTFKLSLALVLIPSLFLVLIYMFFPNLAVSLFFWKKEGYLAITPYLALFALFTTLYCVLSLLSYFYLSIQKTKICIPILIGAMLQIVLIYHYHETFFQIIIISLVITAILICLFLCYYPFATKSTIKRIHDKNS